MKTPEKPKNFVKTSASCSGSIASNVTAITTFKSSCSKKIFLVKNIPEIYLDVTNRNQIFYHMLGELDATLTSSR
jgi:hypothetical protein